MLIILESDVLQFCKLLCNFSDDEAYHNVGWNTFADNSVCLSHRKKQCANLKKKIKNLN